MDRENQIRERAYYLWEEEGRPHDRAQAHWAMAEVALRETTARKAASSAKKRGERSSPQATSASPVPRTSGAKKTHATLQ